MRPRIVSDPDFRCVFPSRVRLRHTSATRAGASACFGDDGQLRRVSEALPAERSPQHLLGSEPFDEYHRPAATGTEQIEVHRGSLAPALSSPPLAPLVAVRAAGGPRRREDPLEPLNLQLLRSRRRRHVLVELPGFGLRNRAARQPAHDEGSPASRRRRDLHRIAALDLPVGPRRRPGDVNFPPLTGGLGA